MKISIPGMSLLLVLSVCSCTRGGDGSGFESAGGQDGAYRP